MKNLIESAYLSRASVRIHQKLLALQKVRFYMRTWGQDDGEAESPEGKHWINNESVCLCPVWSAFSWTCQLTADHWASISGRAALLKMHQLPTCQWKLDLRLQETKSLSWATFTVWLQQVSLELHHVCSLERQCLLQRHLLGTRGQLPQSLSSYSLESGSFILQAMPVWH